MEGLIGDLCSTKIICLLKIYEISLLEGMHTHLLCLHAKVRPFPML